MSPALRRSVLPLAAAGFVGLAGQGLLVREHLRLHGGDELVVALFLGGWLLWVVAGSALHRRFPGPPGAFPVVAGLQLLGIPLAAWLTWRSRTWAGLGPSDPFPPLRLVAFTVLSLLPAALPTGWLLPAGARRLATGPGDRAAVARAWAAEALGGAAGGLAVTLVLTLGLPMPAALESLRRAAQPLPAGARVLDSCDSPLGSWTVARAGGATVFLHDGSRVLQLGDEEEPSLAAGALLAQRPLARRGGVLGEGGEYLACRLLDAGLDEVTLVAADPSWPGLLERHAPPELASCLADPRLRRVRGDRPPADASWDLAWIHGADPGTAAAARGLSLEAFLRLRGALGPAGVLGFTISVTENVLEGPAAAYAAAVDRTLAAAFTHRLVTGGEAMMLLASDGALQGDPAVLAAALDTGAGPSLGLPGAHLTTLFEPSPMAARRDRLDREEAPVLREGHPEVHALRLQLKARATGDPVAGFLAAAGDVMPWLLVVLAPALLLVLAPRVRRGRDGTGPALLLAGFGGAAAMTWQCVILLAWQLRFGNLGIRYGLLSGLFMAGLWAGARRPAAPGGAGLALRAALLLGTGALLLAALYLPAGPAAWLLLAGLSPGLGAATGAILPAAAAALSAAGDDPGRAAARLSVADHLGAVVASLAAGLVLLPRAGLSGTVALGGAGVLAAGILAALAPPGASGEPSRREVRRGRLALALLLVATVSLHRAVTQGGDGPGALPRAPVGAPAVAAPGWEARQEPFPHLLRRDAAGRVQRLRVTDGAPCFPGYEGPVRLHLDLDAAGTVLDARMGPHRETPAYVWGIEAWVHDLRGRRAAELHLAGEGPGEGLDALTGATVTCRSLLASARAASRAVESAAAASPGAPAAPGHAAAGDDPLPEPPRPPELPRLHRRDEVQTPHQRTVDRGALEERIREGTLSKRAAEHWLPVP